MDNRVIAEIQDSRIYLTTGYGDKDMIRQIPGVRWSRQENKWHTALSWSACKQLRGIFKERLEIGPNLLIWAQNVIMTRVGPSQQLRLATSVVDDTDLVPGLYDFQKAGALFLITAQKAILGDSVGSGKTIQTIAAARATNSLPALIVTVNSMKRTWQKEIAKWWPGTPTHVVEGSAAKRAKIILAVKETNGIVIINFESVRLHSRLAGYGSMALTDKEKQPKELNMVDWKLMVIDEAHKIASPQAKVTRACWAIGDGLH